MRGLICEARFVYRARMYGASMEEHYHARDGNPLAMWSGTHG